MKNSTQAVVAEQAVLVAAAVVAAAVAAAADSDDVSAAVAITRFHISLDFTLARRQSANA